jgi:Protein of unknown function (DUF1549)/Protein of unknown function (DUF1553)
MTNHRLHASMPWMLAALAFAFPIPLRAGPTDKAGNLAVFPAQIELAGMNEGRQLVVSAANTDLTREAQYSAAPPGIVRVSPGGYVRPIGKGEAAITIDLGGAGGQRQTVPVSVRDFDESQPLHFGNDIVPLLTRHGCNSGGCHGKASGQNGFKLSLFGFDPGFDFNALVKEGRGRRIFPGAREGSLILTKASARVPHGGGRRLTPGSEDYQTVSRWIEQGTPFGDVKAPSLARLEVVPGDRILARNTQQQIAVLAHYVDGSIRDVTRQAQYQSNEMPVAAVEDTGLVRTFDLAGEAAVMARYQGQVAVFRATVPLGKTIDRYPDFPTVNFVDKLALAKWKKLGLVPSDLCTDGEFIRRVTLDLCGKLPAPDEVRAFLADERADKRARLIDRCLEDKDYPAYFAMRWGSILRNASLAGSEQAAYAFHDWLRDMIGRNRPYDAFVRGIVAASGEWQEAPAINWFWQMRDDQLHQPVADTAQVFLGLRLQCAKCHHHPYERWSQDDYYGLAGFFSRLGRKGFGEPPPYFSERRRTTGEVNPRTNKPIEPKLLDGPVLDIAAEEDPRHKLVDWMARPDNPFFARALCNRMWGHLMGRGLVDPVDDMRETNPPSNPALLDALAGDFIEHKFDVKHLLRTLCNSRTYQLSSVSNDFNRHDKQNHARFYGKRLLAEVLLDSVDQVCGTRTNFNKMSKQARAVDLPHENFGSYFLDVFDRPPRSSACECARSNGANLSSVLHLTNSPEINDKIASGNGRVAKLVSDKAAPEKAIEDIYLAAFARLPTPEEKGKALLFLQQNKDPRAGLEDLVWALLNTREFLFNH